MRIIDNKLIKYAVIFLLITILFLCVLVIYAKPAYANKQVARPSSSGFLHVQGTTTYDENNSEALLHGISTHGLTYAPEFVNNDLFSQVSNDWSVNLVRLAMYSDEYCHRNKLKSLDVLHKGIEYAINNDMYVIVDWHILKDSNPNININQAKEFFETISEEYKNCPNIIYEICNEPNGETTWDDIRDYSNEIIPIIRNKSSKSLILVGTPDNSRDINVALSNPLSQYPNIMYVFHFYSASHKQDMRQNFDNVVSSGLPVFVSEFGLSEESGDGKLDFTETCLWLDVLNKHKINYASWSFSNINETSAMFKNYANFPTNINDENLSSCGLWLKSLFLGENPFEITITHPDYWEGVYSLRTKAYTIWWLFAIEALILTLFIFVILFFVRKISKKKHKSYTDIVRRKTKDQNYNKDKIKDKKAIEIFGKLLVLACMFFFITYLLWRVWCSLPLRYGYVAIILNIILLIVEILGFVESLVMGISLLQLSKYNLPKISENEYPDVDVFIATYNESSELLTKTINGCLNMNYPDKNKVHIYLCDDGKRKEIKKLSKDFGIGYFDRDTNEGAKAGNLNNALYQTTSDLIVTFDADMIPTSDFLLKTIPYFVDADKLNKNYNKEKQINLGFVQTPQSFYQPDIFQHNLYLEDRATNEQDFFYQTIEVAKTSSNSVIYGGSNTVISRRALNAVGGFYTESITEDFATGMLIEAEGFVGLAIPETLAHGQTPNTFQDHIKQRIRWGRGVISTRRNLKKQLKSKLSFSQKVNYWSSSSFWYFPIKMLIYLMLPILYSVFGVIVIQCTIYDLLLFWIPQLLLQIISLRIMSKGNYSFKLNTIAQVATTPFMLVPIIKEYFGLSMKKFLVTDKSGNANINKKSSFISYLPFIIFIVLSIYSMYDALYTLIVFKYLALIVLIFWLFLNLLYAILSLLLISSNRQKAESTIVAKPYDGRIYVKDTVEDVLVVELSETKIKLMYANVHNLNSDDVVNLDIIDGKSIISLKCKLTGIRKKKYFCEFEVLEDVLSRSDYLTFLYNRKPSLPNKIIHVNIFALIWKNLFIRFVERLRK